MTRRPNLTGATIAGATALVVIIGDAAPAYADNCSGLADCTPGVFAAAVLLGGMLGLGLLMAYASSGGGGTGAGGGGGSGSGSGQGGSGAGGTGAGGGGGGGAGTGGAPGDGGAPPPIPPAYDPNYRPPQDPPTPEQQQRMDAAREGIRNDLANGKGPEVWAPKINPTGNTKNCVEAAKAVDSTLGNNPKAAGPVNRGQNGRDLQDAYPGRGQPEMSPMSIEQNLLESGPGSRGIVSVDQAPNGHTFNVYNDNGTIKWIDGQSGRVSTTPGGVLKPIGYSDPSTLEFMKTFPP